MKRKCFRRGGPALFVAVLAAAAFVVLPLSPAAAADEPWPHPSEMRFERITFDPVEPVRFELSNGIAVYFLENHDLPIVSGRIFLPAGRQAEAQDETGLSVFLVWLLDVGGGGELSPEEVDNELDFMASEIRFGTAETFASVEFKSLSEFAGRTLEIATDLLMNPRFPPERAELARARLIDTIRRRTQSPYDEAKLLIELAIAQDHPVGRSITESAIRSFSLEDAVEFHRRNYGPEGTVIAVAGDIDLATLRSQLERTIGRWRPTGARPPAHPELKPPQGPKLYHLQRNTDQTYVAIGYPALKVGDPDRPAIELANQVLGAPFYSRLLRAIRATGLGRDAVSTVKGDMVPFFYAVAIAQASATTRVIELMRAEIRRLIDEPITPAELEQARTALLSKVLFLFDTPLDVAVRMALAEYHGFDPEYWERYVDRIQSLTPEDVQAALQRWLDPDRMITLIIGNEAAFDRPLSDFGEVEEFNLEI